MPEKFSSIGIVGGVGPVAGVSLVQRIFDLAEAQTDQGYPNVLLASFGRHIPDRTAFLLGEHSVNPAESIGYVLRMLADAGSTVVGIPCNTAHAERIWGEILQQLTGPAAQIELVSMVDETFRIAESQLLAKRVGILATTGSVQAGLFQAAAARRDMVAVVPDAAAQARLQAAIYDAEYGLKATGAEVSVRALETTLEIARTVAEGSDCIIVGCTELSLIPARVFDEAGIGAIHSIDALAAALLQRAQQ